MSMQRISTRDLFQRVRDVLAECDGEELERIANEVLVERVVHDAEKDDFVIVTWGEAGRPEAANLVFRSVMAALQDAEEIGGPEGVEYVRLMDRIRHECAQRISTYVGRLLLLRALERGADALTR